MRQRLALIGFSYFCGLIFASIFSAICPGAAVITLIVTAVYAIIKGVGKNISIAGFSLTIGILFYSIAFNIGYADSMELTGSTQTIIAHITDKQTLSNDSAIYKLKGDKEGKTVRFAVISDNVAGDIGDMVKIHGDFKPVENTAGFSSADYYRSDGIFVISENAVMHIIKDKNPLAFLNNARREFISKIDVLYPDNGGGLIKALFFSDKSNLDAVAKANISAAGAAHFTAVSGMHLSLVLGFIGGFISFLLKERHYILSKLLMIIITVMAAIFFGLSPSVIRCCIMLAICNIGDLFLRPGDTLNSLGTAIIIITLPAPLSALNPALLFTMAATIGTGVMSPALVREAKIQLKKSARVKNIGNSNLSIAELALEMAAPSICACAAIVVLCAVYFGFISPYSAISTMIALPFVSVILLLMVAAFILPFAASFLISVAHFICVALNGIFALLSKLPLAVIPTGDITVPIIAVTAAVVFGIAMWRLNITIRKRLRTVAAFAFSGCYITIIIGSAVAFFINSRAVVIPKVSGDAATVYIKSDNYTAGIISGNSNAAEMLYQSSVLYAAPPDIIIIADNCAVNPDKLYKMFPTAGTIIASDDMIKSIHKCGCFKAALCTDKLENNYLSADTYTATADVNGISVGFYTDYAISNARIGIFINGGKARNGITCSADPQQNSDVDLFYQNVEFEIYEDNTDIRTEFIIPF